MKIIFVVVFIGIAAFLGYTHSASKFETNIQGVLTAVKDIKSSTGRGVLDNLLAKEDRQEGADVPGAVKPEDILKRHRDEGVEAVALDKDVTAEEVQKGADIKVMMTPIAKMLLDMQPTDIEKFFIKIIYFIERLEKPLKLFLYFASVFILALMLLTFRTSLSGWSFLFARTGYWLGIILVVLASFSTASGWLFLKYNFHSQLAGIFFIGPLALVFSSAVSLKLYDFNNPIWNRLIFTSVIMLSSVAVTRIP